MYRCRFCVPKSSRSRIEDNKEVGGVKDGSFTQRHPSPSICMCIDLFVHNLLVCMSFCFVMVRCVRKVFDEMFERDSVTWNLMINRYAKIMMLVLARHVFDEMS